MIPKLSKLSALRAALSKSVAALSEAALCADALTMTEDEQHLTKCAEECDALLQAVTDTMRRLQS